MTALPPAAPPGPLPLAPPAAPPLAPAHGGPSRKRGSSSVLHPALAPSQLQAWVQDMQRKTRAALAQRAGHPPLSAAAALPPSAPASPPQSPSESCPPVTASQRTAASFNADCHQASTAPSAGHQGCPRCRIQTRLSKAAPHARPSSAQASAPAPPPRHARHPGLTASSLSSSSSSLSSADSSVSFIISSIRPALLISGGKQARHRGG